MIAPRDISFEAFDGLPLAATLFEPPSPAHALIVGGATAVPRGFYRAFASYLAERGVAVLTYDYRGAGGSPAMLRRSNARMRDWGTLDFPGAVAYMRARYPELPLRLVGHSFGGHALFMAPNNAEIARTVLVASHCGYYGLFAPHERRRLWFMLQVAAPLSMRLQGYVPMSRFGMGEDIANGVMADWRRWCTSPNFFYDDPTMLPVLERVAAYRAPTLSIGLTDDGWGTRAAIEWLAQRFAGAPVDVSMLDPRDYDLESIGHMGFFRSRNGPELWPLVCAYLNLMEVPV